MSLIKFTICEVVFSFSKAKLSCLVVKSDVLIINQEIIMFACEHCYLSTPKGCNNKIIYLFTHLFHMHKEDMCNMMNMIFLFIRIHVVF
jgi:hypothetical protein